jgi:hypothetical protein
VLNGTCNCENCRYVSEELECKWGGHLEKIYKKGCDFNGKQWRFHLTSTHHLAIILDYNLKE